MTQDDRELQEVMNQLSLLEPGPGDVPKPASRALAEVQRQIHAPRSTPLHTFWRSFFANSNRRMATAVALLTLVFAFALSFPSVRAAASDFLGLFRVQKFAAIAISPQQLAVLSRIAEEGLMPGEIEVLSEPGATHSVASLQDAAQAAAMDRVRTPSLLGDADTVFVMDGGQARLTLDLEGVREILTMAGADPSLLPDSLDGTQVDVVVYAGIELDWDDGTWLVQMPSPLVTYPEDLNYVMLGEALLQALGMSPDEAARLAQQVDWTSTLLLPIPQSTANFNEVNINGSSGLALSSLDDDYGAVIWQQDGILYLLSGQGSVNELIRLANSVR
ncbi:MAG: hypothetical protein H6660_12380 [Ardenticatenaceae bacterium]|nr:hypothetical protein [Ardenticatenaceae bacterium]